VHVKATVGEFLVQRLIRWGDTEAAGGLGVCLSTPASVARDQFNQVRA
jgi:hypothetical protein